MWPKRELPVQTLITANMNIANALGYTTGMLYSVYWIQIHFYNVAAL